MSFSIPKEHLGHWMEPQTLTITRSPEEKYCENCGEEIPWHNNSCTLLKTAYAIRTAKCNWCMGEFFVGGEMYIHVVREHKAEVDAAGIKLDPKKMEEIMMGSSKE